MMRVRSCGTGRLASRNLRILRAFGFAGLIGAMACLVLASSASSASTKAAASTTKLVVAWQTDEPPDLDRQITPHGSVSDTQFNVTDPVIRMTVTGKLLPGLATSWKDLSPTVLRINFRHDVTFSDGTKFNAKVFKLNMDRYLLKTSLTGPDDFPTLKGVKVVGTYAANMYHLPDVTIPKELAIAADMFSGKQIQNDVASIKTNPIGSGPYLIKSYQSGRSMVLVARKNYWGAKIAGFGTPSIKEVDIEFGIDPQVRIAQFKSGEVQLAMDITPTDSGQVPQDDVLTMFSPELYYLAFGLKDPLSSDVQVRHAISLALDRRAIANIFGGHGIPASQMWPSNPAIVGFKSRPVAAQDLAQAKQLIQQAGVAGQTIDFRYAPDFKLQIPDVAQAVASEIEQTGLKVNFVSQGLSDFKTKNRDKQNPTAITLNSASYETLEATRGQQRFGCTGPISYYCNQRVEADINKAQSSDDPAVRTAAMQDAQNQMDTDYGVVPIVNPPLIWIHSPSLHMARTPYPEADFAHMKLTP